MPTDTQRFLPPQAPEKPLPTDCCGSGCPICVHEAYENALAAYQKALKEWKERHD